MEIIETLDPDQRTAALAGRGRIRVNAGAGTGKTRTLTARVVHLLASGMARPEEILIVTFTNKAAREIRERVGAVLGREVAARIRMGTFHSVCARTLRRYAPLARLRDASFVIVDETEAATLIERAVDASGAFASFTPPEPPPGASEKAHAAAVKQAEKEHNAARRLFVKETIAKIERWKESGLTVDMVLDPGRPVRTEAEESMARAYVHYQADLEARNMVDFADLVAKVVRLFDEHPDIRRAEAERTRFLLVDEAQDSNRIQIRWMCHVTSVHGNRMRVGDFDQSLYSWRGADPSAMDEEDDDFLDVTLRTNRRCTEQILAAANLLVDLNPRPGPKELRSGRHGERVGTSAHANEFQEAAFVAQRVRALLDRGVPAEEVACLYRTAWPMGVLEKAFVRARVPYVVVGGTSLLEREEVRDAVAYLRLAVDPSDELAFSRIANKPVRGLGPAAIGLVCSVAAANAVPFHEACLMTAGSSGGGRLKTEARENLSRLGGLLSILADMHAGDEAPGRILRAALRDGGYVDWLRGSGDEDAPKRIANLEFLMGLADEKADAIELMEQVALSTDGDAEISPGVRLMTMHASKGLEFDWVFCLAFEDGITPSRRALEETPGDPDDPWVGPGGGGLHEERRIVHVAFTRARHGLHVSCAYKRAGRDAQPSPFFREAELPVPKPWMGGSSGVRQGVSHSRGAFAHGRGRAWKR